MTAPVVQQEKMLQDIRPRQAGQARWGKRGGNQSVHGRLLRMSHVSRGRIYGVGGVFVYLVWQRNDNS